MKKANEINKAIELTQDTAKATLDTSVEVAKLAENSIEGLYKVGYDMNAAGLKVAKGYWDALSAIRNEWINLFAQTGEKAVDSIGALNHLEIPFQKEVTEFGSNIYTQGEKVFNMATDQVKSVANKVTAQVEKATEKATKEAKKTTQVVSNKAEKVAKVTKDVVGKVEKTAENTVEKTEKVVAKAKKAASSK